MQKMVATFYCRLTRLIAIPASSPFQGSDTLTVECSSHFPHTQQFLSNAKNTQDQDMCGSLFVGAAPFCKPSLG